MCAAVKRFAAHVGRGLARQTDLKQDFSVEGALANRVVTVIGEVNRIVRAHLYAMSALEYAFAPRV